MAEQTVVDEVRSLAKRWIELWQATWKNPNDANLDLANGHLYSLAQAWIDRRVVPEVAIMAAEWLRRAASDALECLEDFDDDELDPEWAALDREIVSLYERIKGVPS